VARSTLIDFFDDLARADGEFLVYDDGFRARTFSYREVGELARRFAGRLRDQGLRKGDKAVFFSENRPEWIVAFWGCLLEGVIVVPIDFRSSLGFLERVSHIVEARLVLVGQEVPGPAETIGAPVWKLIQAIAGDGAAVGAELARPSSPPVHREPPITADDIAEIIFTSGATADPKGVVITHRNILANIVPVEREVVKYRKWGRPFFPLRFLNLLPLSHMFGQAMATFIPPMLPGVVIFMRGYNPAEIAAQIKSRRVSVLVSVPKILEVLQTFVAPERRGRSADRAAVLPGSPDSPGPQSFRGRSIVTRTLRRWWHYRGVHRLFGWKFWAFVVGAAPLDPELEAYWGEMGFAVIQGYGLTETAPIVTLNHPFATRRGSVGKAIAGVEVKIAADGEILVRGENVTTGYFGAEKETAAAFEDGWFHTGDVGEIGADGQLYIRGRKKEMIVTPEGLNVFPEDVERVLTQLPGVRDAAVIGGGHNDRVHAVLAVDPGADVDAIVRSANSQLADHQKIRRALVWPEPSLPRTEGTRKLRRAAVAAWANQGAAPPRAGPQTDAFAALIAKYAGRGDLSGATTIDELGLSSLERVELMVALEDAFERRIDEGAFAAARDLSALRAVVEQPPEAGSRSSARPAPEPVEFPAWNRRWPARALRRISLPTWILPLARVFARIRVEGRDHLAAAVGPVIFAANHQSHMDTPVILAALPPRLRYRVATAMAKEFFKAHFFPETHSRRAWLTNSLNYYLAALFFNAFPIPQREAGARQTLRYMGDLLDEGFSVLIYPEGRRTQHGEIDRFRPGIGMIGARLGVPVVPVRIEGLDQVLHQSWKMAKPGPVRVAFGAPLRLAGDDFEALARQVENAVRAL
jgi:long-chain acyl-CoA synthetase